MSENIVTLNLSALTDAQLEAIRILAPDAYRQEKAVRSSFATFQEAADAVSLAEAQLRSFLETSKSTKAGERVQEIGVISIFERLLATFRAHGVVPETPALEEVVA